MQFLDVIYEPWPWYVAGPLIAGIMFLLIYFGKEFGMSSTMRTMCSVAGAGKIADFFRFDWKKERWNLLVVLGAIVGGYVSANFLTKTPGVDISAATSESLEKMGFAGKAESFLPPEIFGMEAISSPKGLAILITGGFLVGFGSRYAGGCTSGHAISGLSNLQWPSLQASLGFFAGGLIMTHFILPYLF
ncbi:MAG: YeeE/YedE thiosulfate transporter family protein [Bacteroidota bacterium]